MLNNGDNFQKECLCGCGELIWDRDNLKRQHFFKMGHNRKGLKFPYKPQFRRRAENHYRWKGGKNISPEGYVFLYIPGHPRAKNGRYVFEHIIVMENHMGRHITKDEVVHHKNGIKTDNRLENLELMTRGQHQNHHHMRVVANVH